MDQIIHRICTTKQEYPGESGPEIHLENFGTETSEFSISLEQVPDNTKKKRKGDPRNVLPEGDTTVEETLSSFLPPPGFLCRYCGFVYERKQSCRAHERTKHEKPMSVHSKKSVLQISGERTVSPIE